MINLADPTKMTVTEALIMVLNAQEHIESDLNQPILAVCHTGISLRSAEYQIRVSELEKRNALRKRSEVRA